MNIVTSIKVIAKRLSVSTLIETRKLIGKRLAQLLVALVPAILVAAHMLPPQPDHPPPPPKEEKRPKPGKQRKIYLQKSIQDRKSHLQKNIQDRREALMAVDALRRHLKAEKVTAVWLGRKLNLKRLETILHALNSSALELLARFKKEGDMSVYREGMVDEVKKCQLSCDIPIDGVIGSKTLDCFENDLDRHLLADNLKLDKLEIEIESTPEPEPDPGFIERVINYLVKYFDWKQEGKVVAALK